VRFLVWLQYRIYYNRAKYLVFSYIRSTHSYYLQIGGKKNSWNWFIPVIHKKIVEYRNLITFTIFFAYIIIHLYSWKNADRKLHKRFSSNFSTSFRKYVSTRSKNWYMFWEFSSMLWIRKCYVIARKIIPITNPAPIGVSFSNAKGNSVSNTLTLKSVTFCVLLSKKCQNCAAF